MRRQATILRVFAACPKDVEEELAALQSVILELNNTWANSLNVHLDLISWKTHAYPGIGSDAQDVINSELGDSYEIFIGMLSTRFGSQTPRAGSGTVEEFERAYNRYKDNPLAIRVMFYFKDPEIKASTLDIEQFAAVKAFQNSLGSKGVLYWTFDSAEEFTSLIRVHLSRQVQDWVERKWGEITVTTQSSIAKNEAQDALVPAIVQAEDEEEAELGLFDLVEIFNENLDSSTGALSRIQEALNYLTRKTEENTSKLTEANSNNDITRAKQIITAVAHAMDEYSDRTKVELPIFSNSYLAAMEAISRAAALWATDFQQPDNTSLESTHDQLLELPPIIISAKESMISMQQTLTSLPRLTSVFNRAKKQALRAVDTIINEFTTAHNLTVEVEKQIALLLGK